MKKYLGFLLLLAIGLVSCSENLGNEDTKESNWKERNTTFFREKMEEAKTSISIAKSQYGNNWEQHCNWRIFRNYAISDITDPKLVDSICAYVVEASTSNVLPLATDSVQMNYSKRLIPTEEYEEGKMLEHSGYTVYHDDIFNISSGALTKRIVSDKAVSARNLPGETTALLHMSIGDHWIIYIPAELAYGDTETSTVPANSTIVSEIRLRGIYRAGTWVGAWR